MRMYLDDLRTPIEEFDVIVRSYENAIVHIKRYGVPNFISFDHDLGIETDRITLKKSAYDLAKWIVFNDINNNFRLPKNFTFKVHSQNPLGKRKIENLLNSYLMLKKHNQT